MKILGLLLCFFAGAVAEYYGWGAIIATAIGMTGIGLIATSSQVKKTNQHERR